MKHNGGLILFAIFCLFYGSMHAQIIRADQTIPLIGEEYVQNNIDALSLNENEYQKAGTDQTWDLSNLLVTSSVTYSYVDPASTGGSGAVKAGANLATINSRDDNVSYYHLSETKLERTATDAGISELIYSDPENLLAYPIEYGVTTFSDTWASDQSMASGTFERSGTNNFSVDGTGILILPNGTYENVIRIKRELTTKRVFTPTGGSPGPEDNIATVYYEWYRAGTRHFIARVVAGEGTNNGAPFTFQGGSYTEDIADDITGIRNTASNPVQLDLFPNPALERVTVKLDAVDAINELKVFDAAGREKIDLTGATDNHQMVIDLNLHALPSGVYFIQARSNGNVAATKRFIKQ